MSNFIFDLQRFDSTVTIASGQSQTIGDVTYRATSDAVLNLDDEGAVSGIASGVVVAQLTDADSSPQITFDGSTAFAFSCSSSDSALQVKASGTSISYTSGQVTYSADGFSGAGEVSVTGYMGNILPFDVVFDIPDSGIKFTFDSDNNITTLNADEKVNATLTFPESAATLIENIKPLIPVLLKVDEDTANRLYNIAVKLVSSSTTAQVQGVQSWNQNDKKLTLNQNSLLAFNVLDYDLSMTAEGGNVDGLSFFYQLTNGTELSAGARFIPNTDENAGLNLTFAKSGSQIYDGVLKVTSGAIDIDVVNTKASVEKDTAVTMTLQDGSLAEFKFDNAASITYSANESGLAYLTFGENDGKLEMTIYRGDTPVFTTGIEINGSLTLDTDNQTVGVTKDTTTIITIGNNTATINVTDDAGFKIGLSNDAITITPQEDDGSLNISLSNGDETVFQNTVSVSNGSIIFNPATQEMTLTDGTTISFLINDNYTLTATASGDATSTLSLSTSGIAITPSTGDGSLDLTLTGTSSGSLSANIEVLSGSFILSEGGALTVAKDTELQIKFSDNYIVNFKATDKAGGTLSLGADGITFAPGSDDGGLQLSITRDGQTRSASLDVTGSVTYKLDGSISLAKDTVVRNVFDSGNILTITANTDASGSIKFNPQTGLTITPSTADALNVVLSTDNLDVVNVSSITGSINYNGGVITASDGTKARISYYFGWESDLYTTGGSASIQFTDDRTIYTANEGSTFTVDYLDGTTTEIQSGSYADVYGETIEDYTELVSEGTILRSNDAEVVFTLEKAGNYTINGMAITATKNNVEVHLLDYNTVTFDADAGITFNEQEFSGSGTVTLTDGNITVENTEDNVAVNGTALADSISNSGASVTITGGEGDDLIQIDGDNVRIQYSAGDGNDTIEGLNETSTLSVGNNLYSTQQSGDDLILTVGENKITLVDAANLDELNIVPDVKTATSLVGAMLYRTEAGYPIIAGMAFHPTVYHGDEPTNYVDKETWTIKSSNAIESADGLELSGIHYTPENSNDKWVVIIHGYGHNHKHMYPFAGFFLDNGYNVLMVDQRAAGDSEGSWLTMGTAESADIALWTQEIARRNPDSKITLFGVSMGAATAMLAAARSDIANVTSLVEDCGYSNVVDIINLFNDVILHQDQSTVDMMMPVSESLTGYNLEDAAPINSISAAKMPTLFITGSKDSVVAGSMLPALYNASGAEVKEQFIVEGATHGMAGMYDPVGYSNTTFRFLAEANGEGWETSNKTDDISLRGTKYNDTISTSGDNVTVNTGVGDDSITNTGENVLFLYNEGDGSDTISGFNESTALQISGDYSTVTSGDDVVVTVGEDAITLTDAASLDALNIFNDTTGQTIANADDNTLISGTGGNDSIGNIGDNVTIRGLLGNDTITNLGARSIVDGGLDDDVIENNSANTTIIGSYGNDSIHNTESNYNSISAGAGNDTILNDHAYYATIESGDGDDLITIARGHYTNIDAGDGNDTILGDGSNDWAMGGYATINGGDGNDYINPETSDSASIMGGDGADTIITSGNDATINGGASSDVISLTGASVDNIIIEYETGSGNDSIYGLNETGIISITSGEEYSTAQSGDDVILTVGENTIMVAGASSVNVVNYELTGSDIENTVNNTLVTGTRFDDEINNKGSNVTIDAKAGKDSVFNYGASASINGGAGDDLILNNGQNVTISGDYGDDYVSNWDSNASVSGGYGNDTIYNNGSNATINGGGGNDSISNDGENLLIEYSGGMDTVVGVNETSTISVSGDFSKDDIVQGVRNVLIPSGDYFLTLQDAMLTTDSINVNGETIELDKTISLLGSGSATISRSNVTINGDEGENLITLTDDAKNNTIVLAGKTTVEGFKTGFGEDADTVYIKEGDEPSVDFKDEGLSLYYDNDPDNYLTFAGLSTTAGITFYDENSSLKTSKNVFIADDDWYKVTDGAADYYVGATAKMNHGIDFTGISDALNISLDTDYTADVAFWVNNVYSIRGGAGNTTITGTDNDDTIIAGTGNTTINAGAGNNLVNVEDAESALIQLAGNTTVEGFKTGFGEGTDTIYIDGDPAGVEFKDGGLTFGNSTDSLALSGITTTSKVNIYHERRSVLNKGVFIAENDWYSVQSSDLTVGSGEEVYFVGTTSKSQVGVDFSGISSALNVTMDTAYEDSEDFVPGTTTWINSVYSLKGGAGNTTITGSKHSDTIVAGTGATTINAAAGDDNISLGSSAALVQYTSGDGNDTIEGFNRNSTLQIGDGTSTYSTQVSGSDVIVTVGDEAITLVDASDVRLNIIGDSGSVSPQPTVATKSVEEIKEEIGADSIQTASKDTLKVNNDDGNNLVYVDEDAKGSKKITLGTGGDAVVIESAKANVSVIGGKGNDSLIVKNSAPVEFDMSKGGKDKIYLANDDAKENVTLKGYNVSNNGGIVVGTSDIAGAIQNKDITFGNGSMQMGAANAKVTFAGHTDDSGSTTVKLFDDNDEAQAVGFTNRDGGNLNVSTSSDDYLLVGNYFDDKSGGSTITGGKGNDNILAGGGDVVNAGAGHNQVILDTVENRDGADIILNSGKTTVQNFKAGFEGDRVFFGVNDVIDFKFDGTNVSVQSNNVWHGVLSEVGNGANFVNILSADANGPVKVAVAQEGAVIAVEDELADYYIGEKSGIDFTNYSGELMANLGSQQQSLGTGEVLFAGINQITAGSGQTTLMGSAKNETLYAGTGAASIYGGGGKNLLANSSDDKDGSTTFLVLGNADGAKNTIAGFNFAGGDGVADKIEVDTNTNVVSNVAISGNDVIIEVSNRAGTATERAVISGAVGQNMQFGDNVVAQVNATDLVYDGTANFFVATSNNASISVGADVGTKAEIWLDGKPGNALGKNFVGDIRTIDATASSVKAELAGNDTDNTILAGSGDTSLWGGNGGDDFMQGGAGHDSFYYTNGNGNDTISGAGTGDVVFLSEMTLDQISTTSVSNGTAVISFKDGGSLTVGDAANCQFVLTQGDQYQTYRVNGDQFVAG